MKATVVAWLVQSCMHVNCCRPPFLYMVIHDVLMKLNSASKNPRLCFATSCSYGVSIRVSACTLIKHVVQLGNSRHYNKSHLQSLSCLQLWNDAAIVFKAIDETDLISGVYLPVWVLPVPGCYAAVALAHTLDAQGLKINVPPQRGNRIPLGSAWNHCNLKQWRRKPVSISLRSG